MEKYSKKFIKLVVLRVLVTSFATINENVSLAGGDGSGRDLVDFLVVEHVPASIATIAVRDVMAVGHVPTNMSDGAHQIVARVVRIDVPSAVLQITNVFNFFISK